MPPKKRDRESEASATSALQQKQQQQQQIQQQQQHGQARVDQMHSPNHEFFLQAFEKPTQIYRFLRTRSESSDNTDANMDAANPSFSLESLTDFVSKMLRSSEYTKQTLQAECEEAKFALKPWPIETLVVKKLDRNVCTCKEGMTIAERDEEIAAGIGEALLHSQRLREKLAANLHRERQNARKPDLQQIYSRPPRAALPGKENKSDPQSRRRSSSQVRSAEIGKSDCAARPRRSASTTRSRELDRSKPLSLASREGSRKTPKNFILANKQSVSSLKSGKEAANREASRSQSDLRRLCSKSAPNVAKNSKNEEIESMNELDRLIKKFTVEAEITAASLRSNCPLHAENAKSVIEEKVVILVDAVEGLDRLGVPPQLVKVLKTYHAYLRNEIFDENTVYSKKQQEAADTFMTNFKRINEKRKIPNSTQHRELLSEYSALYQKSYVEDLSIRQLKLKFLSLETAFKNLNFKDKAGEFKNMRSNSDESSYDFTLDLKNWISNGVWNHSCIFGLKGIFGTHCTRYSDRNQLIQYFDSIQNVQRKVYELELKEMLLQNVIPMLQKSFRPDSKEFIKVYKMIVAISQILNIQVPSLADTN